MKSNFPFTDYDFYGYLAAGITLIFLGDLLLNSGRFFDRDSFTFVTGFLLISGSYLVGHLIAGPSESLLEILLLKKILISPTDIMLLRKRCNWFSEKLFFVFVGHEYSALPPEMVEKVLQGVSENISVDKEKLTQDQIFETSYPYAKNNEDSRDRMSKFLNLYGFCRNMSMTFLVSTVLVFFGSGLDDRFLLALFFFGLTLLLYFRFMKFYSAYIREILRAYHAALLKV